MLLFMPQDENCENCKKATARGVLKFWGGRESVLYMAMHHHWLLVWLRFIANVIPQTQKHIYVLGFLLSNSGRDGCAGCPGQNILLLNFFGIHVAITSISWWLNCLGIHIERLSLVWGLCSYSFLILVVIKWTWVFKKFMSNRQTKYLADVGHFNITGLRRFADVLIYVYNIYIYTWSPPQGELKLLGVGSSC